MKICIITPGYIKYSGDSASVKNYLHELGKSLIEKNIDIFIITPHAFGLKKREIIDKINIIRFSYFFPSRFQTLAYAEGISEQAKSVGGKLQVPFFVIAQLTTTVILLMSKRIDAVNSQWLIPQGLVGAVCRKFLGVPHIATIHSSEITLIKKLPLGKQIANFIIANSDMVISVSSHRALELFDFISPHVKNSASSKLRIIPMGVDSKLFSRACNKIDLRNCHNINSKYVILFVGRLVEVKGCEYLIRGFSMVLDELRDIQLLIVGTGPLEIELKRLVIELNIADNVRFEGFVDHDKIWEYYSLSDIVVFPSIVDSKGFEEGFPVVLMEAITNCVPIIATKTKGVMEIVRDGENGILIDQKNPLQIASSILLVLKNPNLREKLSNGALHSKKYDWSLIASEYEEIIKNTIDVNKNA
ncbi:MAG: hypothetical protein STSR0001_06450 [Methanothrix sp.]